MNFKDINSARAVFYGLFASVFAFLETDKNFRAIQDTINILAKNPLDINSENALLQMQNMLLDGGFDRLRDEANIVFYSPSSSYIPMSASYYCEARDDGKKRIEMLDLVNLSNFRRDSIKYKDNEDNIAFIFNFMNHLIQNTIDGNKDAEKITRAVFERILNEIVDQFMVNIYDNKNSIFYKNIAIVLKIFIAYERQLYNLNPSKNKQAKEIEKIQGNKEKIPTQEKAKRNFDEFKTL